MTLDSQIAAEKMEPNFPQFHLRWWPVLLILILGVGRQLWIWLIWPPDRTIQTIHSYLALLPTLLALAIWWVLFSQISWTIRWWGCGIVAALGALVACLVRIDDVTGEVFPILAWRWSPHREDIADAYFKKQTQKSPNTATTTIASGTKTKQKPDKPTTANRTRKANREDWAEYRGPLRDGIVRHSAMRTDWEKRPPVALWRHPVGLGWSSFAVAEGLAFTQEQRRELEVVVCYDVLTGTLHWSHSDQARFSEPLGGDGPRATPTLHEGRLYSFGATGILNCLDSQTGQKIWSHNVLLENSLPNSTYGMAGSPLVHEEVVIVNPGGNENRGLMAFHRITGQLVWSAGNDGASYASPQLATVDGQQQILLFDRAGVGGHNPRSGKELWKFAWANSSGISGSQPLVLGRNQVIASTGYGVGTVCLQVNHSADTWTVESLWTSNQLRLKFNSAVVKEGFLYGLDEGILTCFNPVEGKRQWKGGRYSFGQILLVGEWLLILAESGEVALVEARPDRYREQAKFQAIQGKTWNYPVLWQGLLLVRNGHEMACYDLRETSEKISEKTTD